MNQSAREALLQAAAAVQRLREELKAAEDRFDDLVATPPSPVADGSVRKIESRRTVNYEELNLSQRLLANIALEPERVFQPGDLKEFLGDSTMHSLRSTLGRLAKEGRLESIERGKYRYAKGGRSDE